MPMPCHRDDGGRRSLLLTLLCCFGLGGWVAQVNPENGSLELNLQAGSAFATRLHRMMIARSWYKDRLLELPFEEVNKYPIFKTKKANRSTV